MSPRPINPECIDDDAWWDLEALKLAVIAPNQFRSYVDNSWRPTIGHGVRGLQLLQIFDAIHDDLYVNLDGAYFSQLSITDYGDALIAACKRVAK